MEGAMNSSCVFVEHSYGDPYLSNGLLNGQPQQHPMPTRCSTTGKMQPFQGPPRWQLNECSMSRHILSIRWTTRWITLVSIGSEPDWVSSVVLVCCVNAIYLRNIIPCHMFVLSLRWRTLTAPLDISSPKITEISF